MPCFHKTLSKAAQQMEAATNWFYGSPYDVTNKLFTILPVDTVLPPNRPRTAATMRVAEQLPATLRTPVLTPPSVALHSAVNVSIPASPAEQPQDGVEEVLLGVKVAQFLPFVLSLGLELDMSGPDVQASVKELTKHSGLSACDHVKRTDGSEFASCIVFPTVFLSHSWRFKLRDIVEALQECDPEDVVWFDLVSVPQNGGSAKPFSWWRDTFFENVKQIGKVVMVMKPFRCPVTLTRAWCIFELFATIVTGAAFDVAMPEEVRQDFLSSIKTDARVFMRAIAAVQAAQCEAGDPEDKRRIAEVVEEYGGFGKIDEMVVNRLKQWFIQVLKAQVVGSAYEVDKAAYLHALGCVFLMDGLLDEALPALEEAWVLRKQLCGEWERDTLETMLALGELHSAAARHEEAHRLLVECQARCIEVLGAHDKVTLQSMEACSALLALKQGKVEEGLRMNLECVATAREFLGSRDEVTIQATTQLALLYHESGDLELAEKVYLEGLDAAIAEYGESHMVTLTAMSNLAACFVEDGKREKGLETYVKVLGRQKDVLGARHPTTLATLNNLAAFHAGGGGEEDLDTAEHLLLDCLAGRREALGPNHTQTLKTEHSLVSLYFQKGDEEKAEEYGLACWEKQKAIVGEKHPDTLETVHNLAAMYWGQGENERAHELCLHCFEHEKEVHGEDHEDTLDSQHTLGCIYAELGQADAARALLADCLTRRRNVLGEDHDDTRLTQSWLADIGESGGGGETVKT